MFEERIEKTIAFLASRSIGEQESISLRQIEEAEVPEALKRIFDAEVEQWVEDEKSRLLTSPHFHYGDDGILPLFDDIVRRARNYAQFTREEFTQTLDKSVKLLFNYICRPQWTLVKYLFADRENATTDSLLESLNYFVDYEYYQLILKDYFEAKEMSVIHARKFEELVENIDKEVVRTFDSRQLAQLTSPLFTLFSLGAEDDEPRAPLEALSIFFDDKDFPAIVERLDAEKEHRAEVTEHELILLISDVDFSVSQDIFSIVSQRNTGMGMKPEKHATAAEEFDIPEVAESIEQQEGGREDVGDGLLDDMLEEDAASRPAESVDELPVFDSDEDVLPSMLEESILDLEEDVIISDEDLIEDLPGTEVIEDDEVEAEPLSGEVLEDEGYADENDVTFPSSFDTEDGGDHDGADDIVLPDDTSLDTYASEDAGHAGDVALEEFSGAGQANSTPGDDDLVVSVEDDPVYTITDGDAPGASAAGPEVASAGDETGDEVFEFEGDAMETAEDIFSTEDVFAEEEDELPVHDADGDAASDADVPDDMYLNDEVTVPADDEIVIPETVISDDMTEGDADDRLGDDLPDTESILPDLDSVELPEIELDTIEIEGETDGDSDFLIPDFRDSELAGSASKDLLGDIALEELMEDDDAEAAVEEAPPAATPAADTVEAAVEEEAPVASAELLSVYGDLNEQIAATDKKKYIKRLFAKDEERFTRAIATLNAKASWREASECIDELFIENGVDMYSRVAVKFTDDVYKRYLNKNS